jgi:hypothetical protein
MNIGPASGPAATYGSPTGVRSVWTKPGHTEVTLMPVSASFIATSKWRAAGAQDAEGWRA